MSKVGRPVTGHHNANNFREKVLKRYDIEFKRIYGSSWFIYVDPARTAVQRVLDHYRTRKLSTIHNFEMKPFTHIVFVDGIIPDDDYIYNKLCATLYATTFEGKKYMTSKCPLWYTTANSYLRGHNIEYRTIDRRISTEKEILEANGIELPLDYEPYYSNESKSAWRLLEISVPEGQYFKADIFYEGRFLLLRDNAKNKDIIREAVAIHTKPIDKHRQYTFQFITWAAYKGELERMKKAVQHYINHDYGRVDIVVSDDDIKSLQQLITQEPKWFPEEQDCTESTEECLQLFIEHWNPSTEAKND